jgi:hypothetical protein
MLPKSDKKVNEDAAPEADRRVERSQHYQMELTEHLLEYLRILIECDQRAKKRGTGV